MRLRTLAGGIELRVPYGRDSRDGHWGSPIRERWGLRAHQQLSLALEERLAFTVTATGSYEEAATLAQKWGVPISRASVHALTQRLGERAEARTQSRLETTPAEREPQRAPTSLAVLMLDGWMVRQRGPGWGKKKTKENRVEWHEWKTGLFYRHEQAARTQGGRGLLSGKTVVGWQGDPVEFARRLHWEALHQGLARAKDTLLIGDGAPWIWNVSSDRWAGATEVLDFYHASQHLWNLGKALHGEEEAPTARWVDSARHRLRHRRHKQVLTEIAALKAPETESAKEVAQEQNYFATHAHRMNYHTLHQRGWPIGSGAVESACRQRQCRFKRSGQFWTPKGMRHLAALTEARHNHHWEELWLTA